MLIVCVKVTPSEFCDHRQHYSDTRRGYRKQIATYNLRVRGVRLGRDKADHGEGERLTGAEVSTLSRGPSLPSREWDAYVDDTLQGTQSGSDGSREAEHGRKGLFQKAGIILLAVS